jgi:tRNA nucleotidyltransferase/poly(A) polymerase
MLNIRDFHYPKDTIPSLDLENIQSITKTLQEAGEECYLVGGAVRDLILQKIPHEYDFTTSAHPEKVKSLFKRVHETGIQHGTVTVAIGKLAYEITTYRSEQGFSDGRRPDSVEFGVSLEEDLKRRDFTINSLAYDILSQKLIDNHNGIEDIQNKLIRTIGDPVTRFTEDGLRPIRGIRFSSSLGFQIHKDTESAFLPTQSITEKIAIERFSQELTKILCSPDPARGLKKLIQYNYFDLFLEFKPSANPRWELIEYFQTATNNLISAKWSLFKEICYFDSEMNNQKNLFRDLKLSSNIEREALFLSEIFHKIESLPLQDFNSFQIKKEFLNPMQKFSNTVQIEKLPLLYNYILTFINLRNKNLTGEIHRILNGNEPLTYSDLDIDGNWIRSHFPDAKGEKIGEFLQKALEIVWEFPHLNKENLLFPLLQSHHKTEK